MTLLQFFPFSTQYSFVRWQVSISQDPISQKVILSFSSVQVDLPSFDLLIAGLANISQPTSSTQVTLNVIVIVMLNVLAACKLLIMPLQSCVLEAIVLALCRLINLKVTSFPLADLLPEELGGFYWYNGSLTEPQHCPEVVQVLNPTNLSPSDLVSQHDVEY